MTAAQDATHSPHGDDDVDTMTLSYRTIKDATHSPHGDDDGVEGAVGGEFLFDATHSPHGDDDPVWWTASVRKRMQLTPLTGTMTASTTGRHTGQYDATHSPHGDDDRFKRSTSSAGMRCNSLPSRGR